MRAKKIVCFFTVLLLFWGLMFSVRASSTNTIKFDSSGVTIVLTYPEEAHPDSAIYHNVTITANMDLDSVSVSLYIYAPVGSTLQHIKNQTLSWSSLPENESLPTSEIKFTPQQANGTLYCNMTVQTEIASTMYYASYSFYTTRVSELTFSEMQTLYYEMLANYTSLQERYETLFNDYNELYANYTSLVDNYTTLLNDYNQLVTDHGTLQEEYNNISDNYQNLNTTYLALLNQYNQLTTDYNSEVSNYNALYEDFRDRTTELVNLRTGYSSLNDTYYSLQTEFNKLQIDGSSLNQTYNNLQTAFAELQERFTDSESAVGLGNVVMFIFIVVVAALIAFIVYIKRKQENPYLVIRKETVSMKSDEET
jgi:predicted nuclease with TOPRIM domain